jgi:glycosyltransferase involved in cell wall biosynthesis
MLNALKTATLDFLYADNSVLRAREQLQENAQVKKTTGTKQLLIDVSVIIHGDARTGIQRVVRAILKQLIVNPPIGYVVRPVFACLEHNYHYAPESFCLEYNKKTITRSGGKHILVDAEDVFLGLDLAAHVLPKYHAQLVRWKSKGVKIHIVVYDLLPVLHPEWFHIKTTRNFYRWLRSLAIFADSAICISKTVKADLNLWLVDKYGFQKHTLLINVIPMGCDIAASLPSKGLPKNSEKLLMQFKLRRSALMVGTLEPRKGHAQIIDAFEELWKNDSNLNLIIVGKAGWKTEKLQARLISHQKSGKNLFWLDSVSDELLEKIYACCYGLILASEGEGFGLPLIEALQHSKPILARDLPVFREVEARQISFFNSDNRSSNLPKHIKEWFNLDQIYEDNKHAKLSSWSDSVEILKSHILNLLIDEKLEG